MNRQAYILVFTFVSLLFTSACWSQTPATQPVSSTEREALFPSRQHLDQGRTVAGSECAQCHGMDGVSTEPGIPHIAGQRAVYLYRALQAYQTRVRRNDAMNHAIDLLNPESLMTVSIYYSSLAPARPLPLEAGGADTGSAIAEGDPFAGIREGMSRCVRCHGEDGNSSASGMPNLSAQSTEYFITSMKAYTDGSRDHRMMKKLVTDLDDLELEKMGVFYAVQEPVRTSTTGDGNADRGRSLSGSCASCHGEDGNASGPDMPSVAGQDARYFVKAMQAYKNGKRQHQPMFEAVESLSPEDISDLAAFYADREPVRRNVRAPLTTGEWIDRCERCHGIEGNSNDPRFPMLAGQDRTYLVNALQSYTGTSRSSSTMHAMAAPLSADDIGTIADYYSTREPKSVIYMHLPCDDATEE